MTYILKPVGVVKGFEIRSGMTIQLIDGSRWYVLGTSHSVDCVNLDTPGGRVIQLALDQAVFLIG